MPESLEKKQALINSAFNEQFRREPQRVAVDGPGFWISETFGDHVIAGKGEEYWKIPFKEVDDEIVFAAQDEWDPVEEKREWVARVKAFSTMAVKLLDQDDNFARVGGYGVIFGGRDIQQETFKKDTDFMPSLVPTKVVSYDHTLPDARTHVAVKHFLGETINEKVDDVGIWVEAQLDKSKKYVDMVLGMVEKGILGWSSATAAHLVLKEGNVIKRWPIIEYALTPAPAEPRALGVQRLKALAEKNPSLEMALLKGSGEDSGIAMIAGGRLLQLKAKAFLLVDNLENLE